MIAFNDHHLFYSFKGKILIVFSGPMVTCYADLTK